ncbi:MAG TPA: hypothetical protein VM182_01050 [Terriglobia bacterium]|nr:hypothetical protein [Terriglobia bacterium]
MGPRLQRRRPAAPITTLALIVGLVGVVVSGYSRTQLLIVAAPPGQDSPTGQNQSRPFAPGKCGPVDPTYIRTANLSGGMPLFLQPSELAQVSSLIGAGLATNADGVLWAMGKLTGRPREFEVPIDSTVKKANLAFSFDTQGNTAALFRPSGAVVGTGDQGVETGEWRCGRIFNLTAPETGIWRLQLKGSGIFWAKVEASSEIFFVSVEFVRPGGRPGHEGLFKIPGQPLAGRQETLGANLSGKIQTAEFRLVSESGETLRPLDLRETDSDPEDHAYLGISAFPEQAFRLAVTGLDSSGLRYQRTYLTVFRATTVEVVPFKVPEDLRAGGKTTVAFRVRNFGQPTTFHVLAVDDHGFVMRGNSSQIALDQGATATVEVDLSVPEETPPGTGVTLTLAATSASDPDITNGTVVELCVASR